MASEKFEDTAAIDQRDPIDDFEKHGLESTKEELAYSPEKVPSLTSGDSEEKIEEVAKADGLPVVVREIVSLEDRPEDLTITFRYISIQCYPLQIAVDDNNLFICWS
jgi:hypothetical protein